jgi:hypothetical protein
MYSNKNLSFKIYYAVFLLIVILVPASLCRADNSLPDACDLGTLSGMQTVHNLIDTSDPQDYYRFSIAGSVSDFTVLLSGRTDGARLQIIEDKNSNGLVDAGEILGQTSTFTSSDWLDPGTYYICVSQDSSNENTEYDLTLTEVPRPDSFGRSDNTLGGAEYLGSLSGYTEQHDFVGQSDIKDYYSFSLISSVRDFTVLLSGRTDGARLQIIEDKNSNGLVDAGEILGQTSTFTSSDVGERIIYVSLKTLAMTTPNTT